MADTKLTDLIVKLADKTEAGKVQWEEGADPNTYQVSFPSHTVQIKFVRSSVSSNSPAVQVQIVDFSGKVIESVTDEDLNFEDSFGVMERMLIAARRRAMGVDEALDSILSALDR